MELEWRKWWVGLQRHNSHALRWNKSAEQAAGKLPSSWCSTLTHSLLKIRSATITALGKLCFKDFIHDLCDHCFTVRKRVENAAKNIGKVCFFNAFFQLLFYVSWTFLDQHVVKGFKGLSSLFSMLFQHFCRLFTLFRDSAVTERFWSDHPEKINKKKKQHIFIHSEGQFFLDSASQNILNGAFIGIETWIWKHQEKRQKPSLKT